ncbi:DUF4302 domain-containing protein [Pontibacter beigongshangensis]|uniref:DUF4302 domain-containing protein n=1 Tax=Pontibacter beigongshangensis TaxID=2574733 RepID=UPI0016504A54|nr:DUF4302 domain-containing protein [Pontibacter beigongshangensis]
MRKILLLCLLLTAFLTACREDNEPAPGERPEERLSKALSEYKAQLISSPYGWKATLYPRGGGGYNFLFKFTEDDRVIMSSDINASTATALESTYRLKTMQRPSLLFDTYSYLHILSDPDATVSGGDWGAGKNSDFEFSFTEVTPDIITLTGNIMTSRLVLTRATQAEAESYIAGVTASAQMFANFSRFTSYFKRLTIGTNAFDINFDPDNRRITFIYFEGETPRSFTTSFSFKADGIMLLEPFAAAGVSILSFDAVQYDMAANRFNLTVSGEAATIQEAARPARVDVQAARAFHNAGADYWASPGGFTINGVEDAHNLRSLPNFYQLSYWAKYDVYQNKEYDLLGFLFINAAGNALELPYGLAAFPTFTGDGRIVFAQLGTLGTIPEQHQAAVSATMQQWTDPQGYYLIRTSENTADLVSARDGKAWLPLAR